MTQIWNTSKQTIHPKVLAFTSNEDRKMDEKIFFPYDLKGTKAHGKMLHSMNILNEEEWAQLNEGLKKLEETFHKGDFKIPDGMEDGHTAIEAYLTENYGEVGKKIHTARSRNDQSLCMIRLYTIDHLDSMKKGVLALIDEWEKWGDKHKDTPMPGYTHMQKAMPTTVGIWQDSYTDALKDSLILLDSIRLICDQSPLGSGAGYGIPMALDRGISAQELGFSKVQENPIYCQMSRGPFESMALFASLQIMNILSKWASDLLLFTMSEFKFFKLPKEYCTSSSIMPQKQNYDVLELMRARQGVVMGAFQEIQQIQTGLNSGYHRDLQLIKVPLVRGFSCVEEALEMAQILSPILAVNENDLA